MTGTELGAPPVLRIVRGEPSPEELAAVVAVLAAAGGSSQAESVPEPVSMWSPPSRRVRADVTPSGWWASALPR